MGDLAAINVIPKPLQVQENTGNFVLNKKVAIATDKQFEQSAELLAALIRQSTGYKCDVTTNGKAQPIEIIYDASLKDLGAEGYKLEVTPNKITIRASNTKGAFYGTQTLRQLLPEQIESVGKVKSVAWEIPCVSVTDKPRF
ncbi:MAG: glycoside hydrolase family 20 zincin-like fold domain-containing protein, partial [Enterococcus faecalis]